MVGFPELTQTVPSDSVGLPARVAGRRSRSDKQRL